VSLFRLMSDACLTKAGAVIRRSLAADARVQFDMLYLLTAIGLAPGGSSTVHIYTQTIHRTSQNKQYIEQHKNFGRVRAVPLFGELYPGICLKLRKKHGKPSVRVAEQ
jgi:hypothetical protein